MIHYYKTHWVLFAKVNARISIKSYKIAITFANNRTSATIREEGFLQMHYFAKCRFRRNVEERSHQDVGGTLFRSRPRSFAVTCDVFCFRSFSILQFG